jgi:hypothetical protein
MSIFPRREKDYTDGMTKQSFKDQCDVNKIVKKAQKTGSLAFAEKYPDQVFGEFPDVDDLLTAHGHIERAGEIFSELPSEVKREFGHSPYEFLRFANDPENVGRLRELLPAIAEPGPYFPNPVNRGPEPDGATAPDQSGRGDNPGTPEASQATEEGS